MFWIVNAALLLIALLLLAELALFRGSAHGRLPTEQDRNASDFKDFINDTGFWLAPGPKDIEEDAARRRRQHSAHMRPRFA